jgi:hypothetical protein
MSNENARPAQPIRLEEVKAGKAVSFAADGQAKLLREGTKPSAPAHLVLPKPVAIPAPAASNNAPNCGKK